MQYKLEWRWILLVMVLERLLTLISQNLSTFNLESLEKLTQMDAFCQPKLIS